MASDNPSSATARRNRIIAIAAGVITAVAITLALASGYLGLTWLWLRPAAELLLLAELVGLGECLDQAHTGDRGCPFA